jgi:hypothetical protein
VATGAGGGHLVGSDRVLEVPGFFEIKRTRVEEPRFDMGC